MPSTFTKKLLGGEDLERHDPATDGTSATTVNRLTSTGGTQPITKIQAALIPMLDAPIVSGANTPFEALADTQAAKNVEAALADLRRKHYRVFSFEDMGAIEGSGVTQGQADKNREVWNQIVSEIGASGRPGGIFLPNGNWVVDGTGAGSPILTVTGKSNITVLGAGFGTNLRAYDSSSGTDLLKFLNCSNITVQLIQLDKIGTGAGSNLLFEGSVGTPISQIRVLNVATLNGLRGVKIDGGGGHGNGFWVQNSYLSAATFGLVSEDFTVGNVGANLFQLNAGGPGGISIADGASANAVVGSINIESNVLVGGGNQRVQVLRTGTYNGAIHKDICIVRNRLSLGDVLVQGTDNTEISNNEMLDGGIQYALVQQTAANFRALYNYSRSATNDALLIDVNNSDLNGWEVVGGRYYLAGAHGVRVLVSTAGANTVSGGRISGVYVLDCNQSDTGNSAIRFEAGAGTTVTRNTVHGNTMFSAAAPKHQNGLHTTTGGSMTNNFRGMNVVQGWQTAAYTVTGFAEHVAGIDEDLGA